MSIKPLSRQPLPAVSAQSGVFISFGSNLGFENSNPAQNLQSAINLIKQGGDQITSTSSIYTSSAWPSADDAPAYVNCVCQIMPFDTKPHALLNRLHAIEAELGRKRSPSDQWAPRTMDLDLLDYNSLIFENDSFLVLPHPRIAARDFVLYPLLEINPLWRHPITGEMGINLLNGLITNGTLNNCRKWP